MTADEDLEGPHPNRQRLGFAAAVAITMPGVVLRMSGAELPPPLEALAFGMSIVGAAFLLSWAAEVAQLDVSAGLAIAVLAFIAVLPEYAVSFVFAKDGGNAVQRFGAACRAPGAAGESDCSLVLANMTGANRLLIGIGWSMVVFVAWYRLRGRGRWRGAVELSRSRSVELSYLALATAYSLLLPLKHSITPVDAVVLVGIFAAYTIRVSRAPAEEPHIVGPARLVGTLAPPARRIAVVSMFLFAGLVILLVAERFADALVETGHSLGVSEFLLVQWLAPIASEAPELLIAGLYAWRLNTDAGLSTLVSSKVNQWTLLVGTLPVVFALAAGGLHGLPIEPRQRQELFLTAAQSFFALAVLITLSISVLEAVALFCLFWAQFVIGAVVPESAHGVELVALAIAYLLIGGAVMVRDRAWIPQRIRDGFLATSEQLGSKG